MPVATLSDITIDQRPERPYVAIPARAPLSEWGRVNALVPEIFAWLAQQGHQLAGAPFYRYRFIGNGDQPHEVDVALPVSSALRGDDRVVADVLPAGAYAVVQHHGHPDQLFDTCATLEDWAEQHGMTWHAQQRPNGTVWGARVESYLTHPDDEPDLNKWTTEVAWLLADSSRPHVHSTVTSAPVAHPHRRQT